MSYSVCAKANDSSATAKRDPEQQEAYFRFYAELNDFLPPEQRHRTLVYRFYVPGSVKDAIESFGVPHTEVDLILANGEPVGFDYRVQPGDRIAVYPVFESLDISEVTKVRPKPLRNPQFVCDAHLGRLAAYLRMLGFDTLYRSDFRDEELVEIATSQKRILLTRDRGLLMHGKLTHGYYVRSTNPRKQLKEVLDRFQLHSLVDPFSRCMECNTLLLPADAQLVKTKVPEGVQSRVTEFYMCPSCKKVYWEGSHVERMSRLIEEINPRDIQGDS